MSGYIDENARIADEIHNAYEEGYADGKRDAVVHGHWIEMAVSSGRDSWKCSLCGRRARGNKNNLPYCHCGAKMDEVTE